MSQWEREVVRRMGCGEYLPNTVLEDGRLLVETGAAGLFAANAARFRKLERSLRRTTWRLVSWFVLTLAGAPGVFSLLGDCNGIWGVVSVVLLLAGGIGFCIEVLVFLTRLWKLMPCSGFSVSPGWRILLLMVPFFCFYWFFLVFPPLRDFPDPRPSSPEARYWLIRMLYFLACIPVLNLMSNCSSGLWFSALILLIAFAVDIVFYLVFRAKACRRAGYLAETYEAAAVADREVAPEWRSAWRKHQYGGWKMAGWIILIVIALWQIDAADQQRRMPGAEFRKKTVASFAAGAAGDAQVMAFRKLAEAFKPLDGDDDSPPALREWLRKEESAAAAMGRFLADHPDFRLSHDWTQGYLMNESEIDAVGSYGNWLAAAIGFALEDKNYAALPELFRRMTDASEFLRREGTMTALRCGMWILDERNELILKLVETPEAWRAWDDEALLQLAAAENRRENDWQRAEPAAVDFAVVAAMDLRQLPDAACLNQTEEMFEMSPDWFYWYRLSWPGIREWRRYFRAIRPYRQLLEVDGQKMKVKQDDWCERYLDKSDYFAANLIDLLDAFVTDRTEFRQGQRQVQIEIARERHRRDHGGRNPEVYGDVVPRYLPKIPLDPDSGEPYGLAGTEITAGKASPGRGGTR